MSSLREQYLEKRKLSDTFNHANKYLLSIASDLEKTLVNYMDGLEGNGLPKYNAENLRLGIHAADSYDATPLYISSNDLSAQDIRSMEGYKKLHEAAENPAIDVKIVLCETVKITSRPFLDEVKTPLTIIYAVPNKPYSASVK